MEGDYRYRLVVNNGYGTSDWYAFNTISGTWTSIAPLPASGRQYCTAFTINGHGYVFGGTDGAPLNELWSYDPIADQWSQRASLPSVGRAGCVSFVLGDKAYIATGKVAPDFEPTTEMWVYDPNTDAWTQGPSLPLPARALSSSFVIGDTAYVHGGQNADGMILSVFEAYTVSSNTWTSLLAPSSLFGSDAFGLADRGVIVCGAGTTAPPYEVSTEVYLQPSGNWMWTPPVFIGTGRKGGCGAVVNGTIYYGTGISGIDRQKDWYKLEWPVGVPSHATSNGPFLVSNLVDDRLVLRTSTDLGAAVAEIRDQVGRLCSITTTKEIDVHALANGRYTLLLTHGTDRHALPFVVQH